MIPEAIRTAEADPSLASVRVSVVGAGIAGLTAAWLLQTLGCDVEVFEAEAFVGGRMSTLGWDGQWIDRAAGTLSPTCQTVVALAERVGLADQCVSFEPKAAVHRNGAFRELTGAGSVVPGGGLLGVRDLAWPPRLLSGLAQLRAATQLPWYPEEAWRAHDGEDAAGWCRRQLGDGVYDAVIEPLLASVYLQDGTVCSVALVLHVAASFAGDRTFFTFEGGIGSLTQALAAGLQVHTGVRVGQVTEDDRGVHLVHSEGETRADFAVMATPADVTRTLIDRADPVLDVDYRPAVVVGLRCSNPWPELPDILFYPRSDAPLEVYAIAESHRGNQPVGDGEVLKIVIDGGDAHRLLDADDETVVRTVIDALNPSVPGIGDQVRSSRVVRHRSSIPSLAVGHVGRILDHHQQAEADPRRVQLAGDYLGFLNTDHAAWSGARAALRIVRQA